MTDEEIAQLEARAQGWALAAGLAVLAAALVSAAGAPVGAVRAVLARALDAVDVGRFAAVLRRAASQGYASGVGGALVRAGARPDVGLPREFAAEVASGSVRLAGAVADARGRVFTAPVDEVLAQVRGAERAARSAVSFAVVRGVGEGVAAAAASDGVRLMWVAERDACLACLSYSGAVAEPGAVFAPLLPGFDVTLPAVRVPPRHPHCRCMCRPYSGPVAGGRSRVDVASGLAREARRSVVLGVSAFDSRPRRLRAADWLIRLGADLPGGVTARGAAAVRRGSFEEFPRRPSGVR